MTEIERRQVHEIRAESREDKDTIVGYAAVFDSEAPETNGFIEKIAPGAFTNALKNSDTRAYYNHDSNKILGRVSANTLQLMEDEKGLYYEIDPPNTTYAKDLIESMKRGDISESSFAFSVSEEKWDDSGEVPVRTIVEVERLYDVSPVSEAWYPQAGSGLKSREKVLERHKEEIEKEEKCEQKNYKFKKEVELHEKKLKF